jgi:hypothetical protein
MLLETEEAMQVDAATKIQAIARGFRARKQEKEKASHGAEREPRGQMPVIVAAGRATEVWLMVVLLLCATAIAAVKSPQLYGNINDMQNIVFTNLLFFVRLGTHMGEI